MQPLAGVRVVTIALNVPGPLAVAHLRRVGARVTKVEPLTGDPLAEFCPSWYAELHEAVDVERLDLKTPDARAHLLTLLGSAQLFVASQRPSALARLGLDAATLLADGTPTAHLRWLNIVGETARAEVAGHDLTYLARAGLLGREQPRTLVADVLGAERAFATALLLLAQGAGAQAQVGLFDSLSPLVAPLTHGLTGPGRLLGGRLPAYGIYEASEGHVALAALEPHFRARLYAGLDLPDGSDLTETMRGRSAGDWESWGEAHDVPIAALASIE
jgi:crotonobetainyl-CoA:carnitine CoA-transferase CaiB-like acyl-CoA transferase